MDKAILVAVNDGRNNNEFNQEVLELKSLCEACEIEIIATVIQNLTSFNPETYVGKGKVEEIADVLVDNSCELLVTNDELSPLQVSNLERELNVTVYDRTYVILEIFRRRAKTKEAQLQVEMATKRYLLPRLTGAHKGLSRQRGAGGGFAHGRGSGEMKLELERRNIYDQIADIRQELQELAKLRQQQRMKRKKNAMKVVSLVGYTNSGKSSTLNALLKYSVSIKKEVFEKDILFATLETSTRLIKTSRNLQFLLTDTVGFVNKLPHQLIEAFKSTLEEITEADLILHIVDSANPNYEKQISVTKQVLEEIGVRDIPVIYVFNKSDLVQDFFIPPLYHPAIMISAKKDINLEELIRMVENELFKAHHNVVLMLPFSKSALLHQIKENGIVDKMEVKDDHYYLEAKISDYLYGLTKEYIIKEISGV
ncbi:MAG: GTPase HflX [Acholeplasmataceae bacterium]|mgnify:CR=1 FL=1|jgi:GTP-binding protein HflX|nr:GTPase HflX [Acholeplasmataceae bacterium]